MDGVALSKCDSRGDAEEEAALVAPYFGFTVIRRAEATLPPSTILYSGIRRPFTLLQNSPPWHLPCTRSRLIHGPICLSVRSRCNTLITCTFAIFKSHTFMWTWDIEYRFYFLYQWLDNVQGVCSGNIWVAFCSNEYIGCYVKRSVYSQCITV